MPKAEYSFENQVVVVTGAGTGIGRGVARGFVEAGARVAFLGRRKEMLEESIAGLPADRVICAPCDVSDRADVERVLAEVNEKFGPVEILVNNAGINTKKRSVAEVEPEDWDRTVEINLTGVFNMVRGVLPSMREQGGGLIVNISSVAGLRAGKVPGAAYCASKHGVVALNHAINDEENEHGIRACVICPGEVATPILDQRPVAVSEERRAQILQPEDLASAVMLVASLPPRACIAEMVITPTIQGFR